jgi:hypothetical protein
MAGLGSCGSAALRQMAQSAMGVILRLRDREICTDAAAWLPPMPDPAPAIDILKWVGALSDSL